LTISSGKKAKKSGFTEEPILTDSETLNEVIECLVENFSIETQCQKALPRCSDLQY